MLSLIGFFWVLNSVIMAISVIMAFFRIGQANPYKTPTPWLITFSITLSIFFVSIPIMQEEGSKTKYVKIPQENIDIARGKKHISIKVDDFNKIKTYNGIEHYRTITDTTTFYFKKRVLFDEVVSKEITYKKK